MRALVLAAVLAAAAANFDCPGSANFVHAKCAVTAHVAQNCSVVWTEVMGRMAGARGWRDPHHAGRYRLTEFDDLTLSGEHTTGAAPHYVDKFTIVLTHEAPGCKIDGCSVSQVTSVLDYSTNYCNVRNLYCGTADGCPTAGADLTVLREDTSHCTQSDAGKCSAPVRS